MVIQFTLQSLIFFVFCVLGITVTLLLIPILLNMGKISGMIRGILEANKDSLSKCISKAPDIVENIEKISINMRETTDKINMSAPVILKDVESITGAVKEGVEATNNVIENVGLAINETVSAYKKDALTVVNYLHIFEEVITIIYRNFFSGKQSGK